MAAPTHNPSRRALLGAAVGLSFDTGLRQAQPLLRMSGEGGAHCRHCERSEAIQTPAPAGLPRRSAPRNDEAWTRALAGFEEAEAELRAFEGRTAGAPWDEQEAVERGMEERLDVLEPALLRLVLLPAPDLPALATKIALVAEYQVVEITGGEGCLAVLERDARRLATRLSAPSA